jgi:hypothetical protein
VTTPALPALKTLKVPGKESVPATFWRSITSVRTILAELVGTTCGAAAFAPRKESAPTSRRAAMERPPAKTAMRRRVT